MKLRNAAALTAPVALFVLASSAFAGSGAEDSPPWKRPMPCVERIPAHTIPDMPPWRRDQPGRVMGSPDCADTKGGAGAV
jgi:hypothetical protein